MYLPLGLACASIVLFATSAHAQEARPIPDGTPSYMTVVDGSASPMEIPLEEGIHVFYATITSFFDADPAAALAVLSYNLKLDDLKGRELVAHMRSVLDELGEYGATSADEVCAGRQKYSTIEDLAIALQRQDTGMESRRAALMGRVDEVLAAGDKERLALHVQRTVLSETKVIRVNYLRWLQEAGHTVDSALAGTCIGTRAAASSRPAAVSVVGRG